MLIRQQSGLDRLRVDAIKIQNIQALFTGKVLKEAPERLYSRLRLRAAGGAYV